MTLITAFAQPGTRPEDGLLSALGDAASSIYVSSLTRNSVFFLDMKTMVDLVLAKAGGEKIVRLRIHDHGNSDGPCIGTDRITVKNFEKYVEPLAKLARGLHKSGSVQFRNCQVGRNENLLQMLAQILDVAVYAATGTVNGFGMVFNGSWTRCSPSGTIYRNAFLPGESDYAFTN